jgi:formylglycine-generating enzyme required for sulfatase activity
VTEVTVGDYRRFLAASGYTPAPGCYIWTAEGKMRQRKAAGWADPGLPATDNMPVTCVNWQDATAYAAWLAVDTGLDVRLPSEAELEYAIRAGSSDNSAPSPEQACATINAADAASRFGWRNRACEDGFPDLASADAVEPNAFGVKGALGNLWEWTADCWSPSHRGAQPDGTARTGTCDSRTLRGGSWDDPLQNLRPSYRVGIPATRRQANVGFRIAIAP